MKAIYPFKRSDGLISPCKKGCPNCKHCTDVFWDYTHGIYMCLCTIHNEHEICCDDYVNDGTEPVSADEFTARNTEAWEEILQSIMRNAIVNIESED